MKIVLLITLFIILGGLLIYQNFFAGKTLLLPGQTAINSQPVELPANYVYVSVQRPGSSVVVNSASLTKAGFVVIYEEDSRGNISKIIGNSRLLLPGKSDKFLIGLIHPIISGEYLYAMVHEDSGDGIFTPAIDTPFQDNNGNIIFIRFQVGFNSQ